MKKSISITLGTMLVPTLMFSAGTAIAGQEQANATERTANVGQAGGGDNFMTTRPANAFYADQLIGTNVRGRGNDDDDFGTVNDLVIGEDGQIQAVIVNVGGFLGIGDRDVAISWEALDVRRDDDSGLGTDWFGNDYVIRSNISSQQIENAPEYERDSDAVGTGVGRTGAGTDGAAGVAGGQRTGNTGENAGMGAQTGN